MKLYKFYKVPPKEYHESMNDLSLRDKYPLYAFTTDKVLRDRFISERKAECFIEIKSKISKEDFVVFANKNSYSKLVIHPFDHVEYDSSLVHKTTQIEVLSTWGEKEQCQAIIDNGMESFSSDVKYDFFPLVLKDKYVESLKYLDFIQFWKLYGDVNKYIHFMNEEQEESFMDYSYPNVTYDEFRIFIAMYQDTFK